MDDYRFACLQDDGSWLVHSFRSVDDDAAVAYGLRKRTSNDCELYCSDRLLATFDGVIQPRACQVFTPANDFAAALVEAS